VPTFQTIHFPTIQATMYSMLSQCSDCGAAVLAGQESAHSHWHQKIESMGGIPGPQGPIGPTGVAGQNGQDAIQHVTNTSITIPSDDLKRIQYWIDGLYVLLGENPVFNVEWDEAR
jgi:hypothetical protein